MRIRNNPERVASKRQAKCTFRFLLSAFCFLLSTLPLPFLHAAEAFVANTTSSPFARVRPVGLDEVRWTQGFWADRLELCCRNTLPALWSIMEGTNYSQFYQDFRIAAGLADGRHRGAPFNDGDFYKYLEAACAALAAHPDPELAQRIEEIVAVLAQSQRPDGYLHTPALIAQRNQASDVAPRPSPLVPLRDPLQFEMYNLGHLLTAACIHHRVTGRTNLLAVACRAADFLDATFRNPAPELASNSICPSHYMGIIEFYRTTREPRYLALAKRLFAMRDLVKGGSDDNQDRIPFEQQTNAVGHAVRANYLYAGAADLFAETGDQHLWTPLERIWTNVAQQKLFITGGCGALYDGASPDGAKDQKTITRVHQAYGRDYQLPQFTAHNETCANIGNVLWNWRMFLITGEARFVDVLELSLYNSVLSGVGLDGTNFFYVNPLRALESPPVKLRWPHQRVPFLNSFCCPPNLARTIAEVSGYAYAKSQDDLWVNLYGSSTLDTRLPAGTRLRLSQQTDYPWNGRVRLTIEECGGTPFGLKLRIPGWAKGAAIRLNGVLLETSPAPGTYFPLRRTWRAGDIVDLDLPMPVNLIEANPFVEEALNQLAVKCGPMVYCLESTDLRNDVRILDVLLPDDLDLIARYDQRLLGGVVALEGKALVRPSRSWAGELYREVHSSALKSVNLRLIPYYAWANRGPSEMTVWLQRANAIRQTGTAPTTKKD
jgi:DUF1680 family protein